MKHQADLLIRNSDYLNETFELTEGKSILISDGKIEAVGTAAELEERYQWKEELDGSGCIYMPGLVDSHMHTGQQLLRGQVLDEMPMIWTRIMLPYESTLTPEKMRLSAQAAAVEMIRFPILPWIRQDCRSRSLWMPELRSRRPMNFMKASTDWEI